MTITINASTSSGLITTPDNSGQIAFQNNGVTELTVTSTGISVADNLSFNSGYGSSAVGYGCRAWVNFNGTGTIAIRVARNVSSITDFGAMYYGVNFTTAMPDANYAWSACGSNVNDSDGTNFTGWSTTQGNQLINVLAIRGLNIFSSGANQSGDCAIVTVGVFR